MPGTSGPWRSRRRVGSGFPCWRTDERPGVFVDMTVYWCARAWLPDRVADAVRIEVVNGTFVSVTPGSSRTGTVLGGLTVPGFANCHSHAFHRALRGRAQ